QDRLDVFALILELSEIELGRRRMHFGDGAREIDFHNRAHLRIGRAFAIERLPQSLHLANAARGHRSPNAKRRERGAARTDEFGGCFGLFENCHVFQASALVCTLGSRRDYFGANLAAASMKRLASALGAPLVTIANGCFTSAPGIATMEPVTDELGA